MDEDFIPRNQWENYLEELYSWINEKYILLENGDINIEEYNDHLEYYEKEKGRIEEMLENEQKLQTQDKPPDNKYLTQKRFEKFFGIGINQETLKSKVQETPEKNQIEQQANEIKKSQVQTLENQSSQIDDNIWELTDSETNGLETSFDKVKDESIITANILLIGDSSVGRTSIRRSWMGKHFIESHLTTIGASIEKKTMELDGYSYYITLTDLGGQDFYSGIRKNFYRNVDGAIIVFDLTRIDTFRRIEYWVKEFFRESKKLVPFVLVGNKFDKKGRVIPAKHGMTVAEKYTNATMPNFRVRYTETSARSGYGVNEVFEMICREIRSFKLQNARRK